MSFSSWNCSNAGCPPGTVEFPPTSGKFVEKEFVVFPGGEIEGVDTPGTGTYAPGGSLPWPSELTESVAGQIRLEAKNVVVELACIVPKQNEGAPPFGDGDKDTPQFLAAPTVCFTIPGLNKQEPLTENGSSIGGPNTSKVTFDAGGGKLKCKGPQAGSSETIEFNGNTEGSLRTFTYQGQEIVKTK